MCFLHSEIFWIAITAIASWVSVFVTIGLVNKQIKSSERDLHIRTQLNLEQRFNSEQMLKARRELAAQLLRKNQDPWETVMEFFESVGLLLRKGSLDKEMVWATFSFYIIHWWELSKSFIEERRKKDTTYFDDFENLSDEMYAIEMKKRLKTKQEVIPTESELMEFLQDEKDRK
jgi:hypothetical protein